MKKTIRVIDLLNKIANGEEVPKKIKYNDDEYIHIDNYCYFCEETNENLSQNTYAEFSRLNDEVEILDEEEFEDIEEIELTNDEKIKGYYNGGIHYMTTNVKDREVYIKLINQLIKNQKKIIEKLNKEN